MTWISGEEVSVDKVDLKIKNKKKLKYNHSQATTITYQTALHFKLQLTPHFSIHFLNSSVAVSFSPNLAATPSTEMADDEPKKIETESPAEPPPVETSKDVAEEKTVIPPPPAEEKPSDDFKAVEPESNYYLFLSSFFYN